MKEDIYSFLTKIPFGMVVRYKDIAAYLGNKNYARYVGFVLHHNTNPNLYPCYKVVNSKGCLAKNYAFGGINGQKMFLEKEKIIVENGKVDLTKYLWNIQQY